MKVRMMVEKEVDIKYVRISVPVRYDDEDIPYDFPFRTGDLWTITVEMDTGRIVGWPQHHSHDVYMKVVDGGTYSLLDENQNVMSTLEWRKNTSRHGQRKWKRRVRPWILKTTTRGTSVAQVVKAIP